MTASQRVQEARKNGKGLFYNIEVYMPACGGSPGEKREAKVELKKQRLLEHFEEFRRKAEGELRCVVRCYNV